MLKSFFSILYHSLPWNFYFFFLCIDFNRSIVFDYHHHHHSYSSVELREKFLNDTLSRFKSKYFLENYFPGMIDWIEIISFVSIFIIIIISIIIDWIFFSRLSETFFIRVCKRKTGIVFIFTSKEGILRPRNSSAMRTNRSRCKRTSFIIIINNKKNYVSQYQMRSLIFFDCIKRNTFVK